MGDRYVLRGTDLRYTLTRLLQLLGPSSVTELVAALNKWNFAVAGRPTKTVSDALRWEMQRSRVWRRGWGRYSAAGMPRSTERRIVTRVEALREDAKSRGGGTTPLPRLVRRVAFEDMADSERITHPGGSSP